MADTAMLSAKFQISIPKTVRTAHCWKASQEFVFVPKRTGVLLVPVSEAADLAGSMKGAEPRRPSWPGGPLLIRLVDGRLGLNG